MKKPLNRMTVRKARIHKKLPWYLADLLYNNYNYTQTPLYELEVRVPPKVMKAKTYGDD